MTTQSIEKWEEKFEKNWDYMASLGGFDFKNNEKEFWFKWFTNLLSLQRKEIVEMLEGMRKEIPFPKLKLFTGNYKEFDNKVGYNTALNEAIQRVEGGER